MALPYCFTLFERHRFILTDDSCLWHFKETLENGSLTHFLVWDKLKLRTGDKVELALTGDSEISLKSVGKTVDEVYGILHEEKSGTFTVNDMKQAIAKKIAEKFYVRFLGPSPQLKNVTQCFL